MALTRKYLKAMGIEDDKIDQIIESHAETVSALKSERDSFKEDAEKKQELQRELEQMKGDGSLDWEKKYNDIKGDFEKYKEEVQKKETQGKKESAYRAILKDANLSEKGIEKAIKYAEWDKIELEADGKLKGASDHIKAAKEEWAEYVTTTTTTGAKTSNPPANNGGTKLTKAEIYARDEHGRYKLSTAERQKALAENPELLN